jgi:hypothetical protein
LEAVVTAIFSGLAFFGSMGLIAALGGSHDHRTTRLVLWSTAAIAAGVSGLTYETVRAIFG